MAPSPAAPELSVTPRAEREPEVAGPVALPPQLQDLPDLVEDPGAPQAAKAATPPQMPNQRRDIDPAIRNILREEAEREANLRARDTRPIDETQGEMALDSLSAPKVGTSELDAAEDAFDVSEAGPEGIGSRRDLLPDIEEINSSLRDTGDRSTTEASATDIDTLEVVPRRRRGVRIGFLVVLAIAGLGVAVYANAELVTGLVPSAASVVEGYVATVTSMRYWLDELARDLAGSPPG